MLSLVMSPLRIYLQVTINPFPRGKVIIRLSKMHEKHLQKTHMLREVADQPPANSIKISFPTGTPPHTPPKQITYPVHTKTSPQTGKG